MGLARSCPRLETSPRLSEPDSRLTTVCGETSFDSKVHGVIIHQQPPAQPAAHHSHSPCAVPGAGPVRWSVVMCRALCLVKKFTLYFNSFFRFTKDVAEMSVHRLEVGPSGSVFLKSSYTATVNQNDMRRLPWYKRRTRTLESWKRPGGITLK